MLVFLIAIELKNDANNFISLKKWSPHYSFSAIILGMSFSEIVHNTIQRNCLFSKFALNGFFH